MEDVIQIQSRSMSGPPLSDIDFKNKMALVWTTVEEIFFSTIRDMISRIQESVTITDRFMEIPFHRKLSQVKNAKDNNTN